MYWDEKSNIWLIVCPFTKSPIVGSCTLKALSKLMHIPFHLNNPYCRSVVVLTVSLVKSNRTRTKSDCFKVFGFVVSIQKRKQTNMYVSFTRDISRQAIIRFGKNLYLFGLSIRLLQFPNNVLPLDLMKHISTNV